MPHATVNGADLHYERRGSGEPLLLIQGMSGTTFSWGEPLLADLERSFDLVVYDHRGIGASSAQSAPFTIGDLAQDAAGLLDLLGWDTAHVLGISMGGMVAQELALRHPARLRTLTLGCTYCGGPAARLAEEAVVQRLAAGMMSGNQDLAIRTGYEVNVSAAFAAQEANYAAFRQMAVAAPAPVPVIMLQMQAISSHDTSARLPSLDVPTLVIHGDEDQMLPVANGRLIASLIPGAQLEEWPGVGHMFWWEQPARTAEALRAHALAGAAAT
jgi:3-oxoadipate enol-lactonase